LTLEGPPVIITRPKTDPPPINKWPTPPSSANANNNASANAEAYASANAEANGYGSSSANANANAKANANAGTGRDGARYEPSRPRVDETDFDRGQYGPGVDFINLPPA
jgi:hypothetical protein